MAVLFYGKRARKVFAPAVLLAFLLLAVSSGILFFHGHSTLAGLLSRGVAPRTTVIYSRWLSLRSHEPITPEYVQQMLKQVGYEEVKGVPEKPGQYRYSYPSLEVFTRDFIYPDKSLPAQRVQVEFSPKGIDRLSAPTLLDDSSWRIDPKVLSALTSKDTALRPRITLGELPPYVPLA